MISPSCALNETLSKAGSGRCRYRKVRSWTTIGIALGSAKESSFRSLTGVSEMKLSIAHHVIFNTQSWQRFFSPAHGKHEQRPFTALGEPDDLNGIADLSSKTPLSIAIDDGHIEIVLCAIERDERSRRPLAKRAGQAGDFNAA